MKNVERHGRALIKGQRRRKRGSATSASRTARKLDRLGVHIGKIVILADYRRKRGR